MLAEMRTAAAAEGLLFGDRRRTYNSRLAQELGKWAEVQGHGDAFHHLAFCAYFADGKNISKLDVLFDLAAAAGLSPTEAEIVLTERRFAAAVDSDWQRARQMGITAIPTFCYDGRRLVGAQSYETIRELVIGQSSGNTGFMS